MTQKIKKAPKSVDGFSVTKIMLLTLLSTTWRIFLPTLGLFGVGVIIDFSFGLVPLCMIAGLSAGCIIAGILVFLQLREVKTEQVK